MSSAAAWPVDRRITIHDLQAATDRGERWPMLTSYDTLTAGLLESVPAELGQRVFDALRIPTVGIGAGPSCDAQIMVWQDMTGLTAGRLPRFVKRYADTRGALFDAAHRYVTEVASQHYPDPAHSYT
jgi:ketopantoate hydroxymethyltransferase